MITAPIFQDTIYIHTGDSLEYRIILEGNTIFRGKAYAAPGESTISINVNRICENYLDNNDVEPLLNETANIVTARTACRNFYLTTISGVTLESYKFLYNYDYDGYFNAGGMVLSDPITNKGAVNLIPLRTYWNGQNVTNMLDDAYYRDNVCDAEYCIYYLNARGGWDAFVIEGSSTRTDNISRHQYNKTYNNQTIEYEKNTYISEITTAWKLNTGLLDDEQAHKLCWHLLSSNRVYLHDLKNDKIYSAVITNKQNVYNTYRNNGHQPIQYQIELQESQTKLRQ